MTEVSRQRTTSWLTVVGLAGMLLGLLEGLWIVWNTPGIPRTDALLVLVWSSVAYTLPSLLLSGMGLMITRAGSSRNKLFSIPGALLPLGMFVGLFASDNLVASRNIYAVMIELPASVMLAVVFCIFLRTRWPSWLNLVGTWVFLLGLILSLVMSWLVAKYPVSGPLLAVTALLVAVGLSCMWGLLRKYGQRRATVTTICLSALALVPLTIWSLRISDGRANEQRNILLITIDTLRADHLGSYGYTGGKTPITDKIATEGIVFEEAFAPSMLTGPSHISILTGLEPFQHGVIDNGIQLEIPILTLPEILSHHGYETAAFISGWTLKHRACGLGNRFDSYSEDLSVWWWLPEPAMKIGVVRLGNSLSGRLRLGSNYSRADRAAAETTDSVLRWLEREHEDPFFLWVHYFDPHIPYAPPFPYRDMFDPDYLGVANGRWYELSPAAKKRIADSSADVSHMISLYDGEVAYVDEQIGRLYEALKRLELKQNTLVIFTADHGESHGEHENYFGRDLYRPSLHVPLVIDLPASESEARRVTNQVRLIDIAPTVLDYLDLDYLDTESPFGGSSLLPLARGQDDSLSRPSFAVYAGQKIMAIQEQGFKLISYRDKTFREELYNVQVDPQEEVDLLEKEPAVLSSLRRTLATRQQQKMSDRQRPSKDLERMLRSLGYVE